MQTSMTEPESLVGKRIILVIGGLEMGGTERQALLLAQFLQDNRGAEVELWGFSKPGLLSEFCDEQGIRWRYIPFEWPMYVERITTNILCSCIRGFSIVKFGRLLRRVRPDIIISYTMIPNLVCGIVWQKTGARVLIWNQRDEGRHRMGKFWEKLAVSRTSWFASNSLHGADFLVQQLAVSKERVRVIHNAVRLAPQKADRMTWRKRLSVGNNAFVACMVANLHRFKDHQTLLKAWKKVAFVCQSTGRDSVLLLAGRFSDTYESLMKLAADLDLGESVRFLGQVTDITGILGAADIGVFSSRFEGSPNAVLECMAAELPIVATDIPGIREALGGHASSFLVPPGDAEKMADKILELFVARKKRKEQGRLNRRRIEDHFNPDDVVAKMSNYVMHSFSRTGAES
ncbi:glycosyltransferase [Verrucomicrobiota bacterium]